VCKLFGRESTYRTDFLNWGLKDPAILRKQAEAYRDAGSQKERQTLFEAHGVRWSELWRLPYWNPTRMLVVDSMHCILEGLVHYHCRHVLRLNSATAKTKETVEFSTAFAYPWPIYDMKYNSNVQQKYKLSEDDEEQVTDIHEILQRPFECEGHHCLDKDSFVKKLHTCKLAPLRYVCTLLNLPTTISTVKNGRNIEIVAKFKAHFIELLLNWMPRSPSGDVHFSLRVVNADTIKFIQEVIRTLTRPGWINHVPHNYCDANAGTIKADEWRTLSTIYLPIALVLLWGEVNQEAPVEGSHFLKVLDHTMALFQAT
ncbi:hypothetical protein BT96DRAFT_793837, partial [Gymnopus androsaceus JB14]